MKIYSFPPISNPDATVLILGTMPGERSLKLSQYYGHGGNTFWKLIFTIFNESFSTDYDIKKAILLKNQIALWDVLEACERESSADSEIIKELPNDFESFFEKHPKIKLIAFNGKNAETFFKNHVKVKDNFTFITLPSTSPANTRKTFDKKLEEWKIIKME